MIYQSSRTEPPSPHEHGGEENSIHNRNSTANRNRRNSNIQQHEQVSATSNQINEQQAISATSMASPGANARRPQPPRNLRPIRPNLRRQIVAAAPNIHHQASVPVGAHQIELATVLPASRPLTGVAPPPQRPAHLPSKYDASYSAGSRGATILANAPTGTSSKPNRYAWAQVPHHWQTERQDPTTNSSDLNHPYHQHRHRHHHHHHGFQHHFASPLSSAASRVLVVNPMLIVNLSEHTKSRLIKFIEAVKRFSEKWFSHVLLLMFLAVYACFGAYIFISFEAPSEQWEKQLIIDTRLRIVNESWHEAQSQSEADYTDSFRGKFEEYETLLNRVCASGMTSSSLENQWTFWGALFYSMTVFTTIGYGHLTPITFAGRVATMIYAIFGIPILLMVLADLGKLLTRIIKSAFKKFRYLYNKLLGRKASIRTRKLISDNTSQYIGVAKDAFERGLAHIQPYNLRIPNAFRGASFRGSRNRRHAQLVDMRQPPSPTGPKDMVGYIIEEPPIEGPRKSSNPLAESDKLSPQDQDFLAPGGKKHSVTTDVIVTPVKQTKPVSPPVDIVNQQKPFINHPDQAHDNGHHSKHHGHNSQARSQSPGKGTAKRKISTNKQDQNKQGKDAANKGSVSRSSSISNVNEKQRSLKKAAEVAKETQNALEKEAPTSGDELQPQVGLPSQQQPQADGEIDTSEEPMIPEEYEEIDEDLDIPVSFALFLLVTYMMLGAVVFSIWEGWNFFDSLYFVFISMSTIGFGDLVPQHPKRMIGTFIYLLLGLALTSMCINVVQEKIHATFLRAKMQIGEKMGLDLDQIMADDYYDPSMGLDVDDEDANSVAVSQTNSASIHVSAGDHQEDGHDGLSSKTVDESRKLRGLASVDGANLSDVAAGSRLSRSKDSLKWKRRGAAGSSVDHSSGAGASGSGGSVKRKPSKKISRQIVTQTSASSTAAQPSVSEMATLVATVAGASSAPVSPTSRQQPIESKLTTEPVAVKLETANPETTIPITQPGINYPTSGDMRRELCQPIDRSIYAARPKLSATRSQPMPSISTAKSLSSETSPNSSSMNMRNYPSKYQTSNGRKGGCGYAKSEGPSRRSSVSNELNQLDDLIRVLSRTPSERFGPLLGIPSSTRSSRSGSISTNSSSATLVRRVSSLRPGTTSPRQPVQKKRSLIVHSPSATGHLNHLTTGDGNTSLGARTISSESQLALDKLEKVKHSAV